MTRIKKFFAPVLRTYNNNIDKRWRIEYWAPVNDVISKRVIIYGNINSGTTIEARTRLAFQLINSLNFNKEPEKTILDKVIEAWSIQWRPKTLSAYTTVNERFNKFLGKKNTPETATESTINDFLLWLLNVEKITNKNTIAKYREFLHTLYNKAIDNNLTSFNPVKKVPSIKRAPVSLQFFSNKQVEAIKEAHKPKQIDLAIKFLFYCFIRPGEQRHMKISWINFEYGFIEIPGKYAKMGKTQKVSIPTHFLNEIEYLQDYNNNFYVLTTSGVPGIKQVSTKHINDEHRKLLDKLKIRGRYAFYSWKHTGAVKAVKAGINIKDLQLQLRHHSLDMVNEYLKNLGVMDSEDLRNRFPTL